MTKMTKKSLKTITVVLCVAIVAIMALPMLSACNNDEATNIISGRATSVDFDPQGKYMTTVSVDAANVPSGIGADDVTISYYVMTDEDGYDQALQAEANGGAAADISEYSEVVDVQVDDVTVKDGNKIEIAFTDSKAAQNLPDYYTLYILLKVKKNKLIEGIFASVEVDYPKVKATPSVSSITSLEDDFILSLELDPQDASEFASDITAENIHLDGAFKGLQCTLESHEPKNLTLKLKGDSDSDENALVRDKSDGTYHDGTIRVDSSKVKMSKYDLWVYIPIDQISIYLGVSGLKFENGKATVPVYVSGHSFAESESATAADFKFKQVEDYHADPIAYVDVDGVTIDSFERTDAHSGTFTISVEGAQDSNDVADKLNGTTLFALGAALQGNEDGLNASVDLAPASFYVVFDYAEEQGENYVFDLILNATHGVFDSGITKDDFILSEKLEGATINSFALIDDETATLQLTVPAQRDNDGNVVPLEQMYLKGTISLKAGKMTSRWGEATDQVDCTRAYEWIEMGRGNASASFDDALDALQELDWDKIFSPASSIFNGIGKVKKVLEFLGLIDSSEITVDMVYSYLQELHEELVALSKKLDEMMQKIDLKLDKNVITSFCKDKLYMLQSYRGYAVAAIQDAVDTLKEDIDGAITPTSPAEGASHEVLEQWTDYTKLVMQQASKQDADIFNKLLEYFTQVCGEVVPSAGGESIIATYDNYISYYYNFDVQAYDDRENFRNAIEFELANSYYILCSYMQLSADLPQTNKINSLTQQFNSVKDYLTNKNPFTRRTDNCFYMYAIKQEVTIKTGFDLYSFRDRKNPTDEWGIVPDSEIADYFNERMRGATIGQILTEDLGYDQSLDDKKFSGKYYLYKKTYSGNWYLPSHWLDYCKFNLTERTFTDTSIASGDSTDFEVYIDSQNSVSNVAHWIKGWGSSDDVHKPEAEPAGYDVNKVVFFWLTTEDLYVNSRS